MTLKLNYRPLQQGYSVERGNNIIEQMLDGGPPRYRRDSEGTTAVVNVSWVLKANEYTDLQRFYDEWAQNPNQAFHADLVIESGELKTYACFFSGGEPPKLNQQNGPNYHVSAQLRVNPKPVETTGGGGGGTPGGGGSGAGDIEQDWIDGEYFLVGGLTPGNDVNYYINSGFKILNTGVQIVNEDYYNYTVHIPRSQWEDPSVAVVWMKIPLSYIYQFEDPLARVIESRTTYYNDQVSDGAVNRAQINYLMANSIVDDRYYYGSIYVIVPRIGSEVKPEVRRAVMTVGERVFIINFRMGY